MSMFLDALEPVLVRVGFGGYGTGGALGYEEKRVTVGGQTYDHALSTHPPARIMFHLGGHYSAFRARVALNDDVPHGRSHADFYVLADQRRVADAVSVAAGSGTRDIVADVSGARLLELIVQTSRWEYSHAVWLDPSLERASAPASTRIVDCLGRAEIDVVPDKPADRCVATVVSPGWEWMLDEMLGSFVANGGCPGARIAVFAINGGPQCEQVASKYGATLVRCRPLGNVAASIKAVLYSVAHVIDARSYLCLDADMLVTGDLEPVFQAIEALPARSILACRETNRDHWRDIAHMFRECYHGSAADLALLQVTPDEQAYRLVVNDGTFAGSRYAMLALDAAIRAMPDAARWVDDTHWVWWRNQFIFNLALARLGAGVELDETFNVQLHSNEATIGSSSGPATATWNGRSAHVLHFNGGAKQKYRHARSRYSSVARPLPRSDGDDAYRSFLRTLRAWAGAQSGIDALAWSFYGTRDGSSARVADASVFPLFAALHYLIRSNGCTRVIETGTALGVSAACIASALAHRENGRVVTLDPKGYEGRNALWDALPAAMRACIEARAVDSIAGMEAALAAGEKYQAALLDSVHTEEQVWSEFELATQLVCPGGLILIHDPLLFERGTVDRAVLRIRQEGFDVVHLWAADDAVREDDGLGLAVVENRRRAWRP